MTKTAKNILYVHYGDNWIRGSERCLIDLIDNIDSDQFVPFIWTNNPKLHLEIEKRNIRSYFSQFKLLFGWQKPLFPIFSWFGQLYQAYQIIKTNRISLIHVNSGAPCQWMWLISKLCKVPMILHLHSDYVLRDRVTLGFYLSQHIVTVSEAISFHLLQDGYPSSRHSTIYNGFNSSSIQPSNYIDVKQRLGLERKHYLLVTCGSLIKRKGMDKLLVLTAELVKRNPDIHLLIIGQGPEYNNLISLSEKLSISQHVHFIGEQTNVIPWLIGGVDLFISSAQSEAFGLVIGEAALAKLPIVAPEIGGIPEIVKHNHSALLYKKWNIKKISQLIHNIKNSPSLSNRLSNKAYRKVSEELTLDNYVASFEQLYIQLLRSKVSSPSLVSFISQLIKRVIFKVSHHRKLL